MAFLRERVTAFPDLSAARLTREVRELEVRAHEARLSNLSKREALKNI